MTPALEDFFGAKLALFVPGGVLAYLRDDVPGLRWAGYWDLPGGGREDGESPKTCVLRELWEEFGFRLDPACISYRREYPSIDRPGLKSWFFASALPAFREENVTFGDEGQYWRVLSPETFMQAQAVPYLKERLTDYLATVT